MYHQFTKKTLELTFHDATKVMKRVSKKRTEVEAAFMMAPLGAVMKLNCYVTEILVKYLDLFAKNKKYNSSKSFTDHYNITLHTPGCGSLLKQVL